LKAVTSLAISDPQRGQGNRYIRAMKAFSQLDERDEDEASKKKNDELKQQLTNEGIVQAGLETIAHHSQCLYILF
jgi:hypothetical protein